MSRPGGRIVGRIIIGYEATSEGLDALRLGRLLAGNFEAEVVLATVLPLPHHLFAPERVEAALAAEPLRLFDRAQSELHGLNVRTRVVADVSPARALQRVAEESAADLIAIGPCHRGALGSVLLGSVGESVLAGAPCPVAVAPRGYSPPPRGAPRHVGVAFDGSPEARLALDLAVRLADRFGAELELLSVAERPREGGRSSYPWLPNDPWVERDLRADLMAAALDELPESLPATATVLEGRPGPALAAAAERLDMILAGSRGYGALRRVLLGATTRSLLRRAPCPVLITPRGVAATPERGGEAAGAKASARRLAGAGAEAER